MSTLVVGDLHEHACHPKYRRFCSDVWKRERSKETVFIGDIADQYMWGRWDHVPEACSPERELEKAQKSISYWHDAFPNARVCIGNHDLRIPALAASVGLPSKVMKSNAEIWDTPTWDWQRFHDVDGVHYTHGIGLSGMYAYRNAAQKGMRSTVIGHVHSYPGITYIANSERLIFGMNVGCGIDIHHPYAFKYADHDILRPILGCGVVYSDRRAQFFPMDLTDKRYRR